MKQHPFRFSICAALLPLAALWLGCSQAQEAPPPRPPLVTIGAGESVTVIFQADGHWHDSGFLARSGDILVFEPLGQAANAELAALQTRIGRSMTQVISPKIRQRVTRRGEIRFRAAPLRLGPIEGDTLEILIKNLRKP